MLTVMQSGMAVADVNSGHESELIETHSVGQVYTEHDHASQASVVIENAGDANESHDANAAHDASESGDCQHCCHCHSPQLNYLSILVAATDGFKTNESFAALSTALPSAPPYDFLRPPIA